MAPGSSSVIDFTLVQIDPNPSGVGHGPIKYVHQKDCRPIQAQDQALLIWVSTRVPNMSGVHVSYHVDAAKPVPDGSFDLEFTGSTGSDTAPHNVFVKRLEYLPAVAGNEKGGTITFSVRADHKDSRYPPSRSYTGRYTWAVDSCPGHADPLPAVNHPIKP